MAERRIVTKAAFDTSEVVEGSERAQASLRSYGETGAQANRRVQQEAEKAGRAYDRLVAAIDPADKATLRYAKAVETANRAVKAGVISQEEANATLAKASTFYGRQASQITSVGDIFDKIGGKPAIFAGNVVAAWASLKAGIEIGNEIRSTLDQLGEAMLDEANLTDRLIRSTPAWMQVEQAINVVWGTQTETLEEQNRQHAIRARFLDANSKRLQGLGPDPFQGLEVGQNTEEEWNAIAANVIKRQREMAAEAERASRKMEADSVRAAQRLAESVDDATFKVRRDFAAVERAHDEMIAEWGRPVNVTPLEVAALEQRKRAQADADRARQQALDDYQDQFRAYNDEQERALEDLAEQYRALGGGGIGGGGSIVGVYRQQRSEIDNLIQEGVLSQAEGQQAINVLMQDAMSAQINAWGSFFNTIGGMFGGFAQKVANAISTVQQGQQAGSSIGQALGGMQGAAAGGAAGIIVGVVVAAYQYMQAEAKKRRAESYGYAAVLNREEGYDWSSPLQGAARRASNQVRETIEEFADALGGVFTSFAALEVQVRRDGKFFRAYVEGQFLGSFQDMQSAVEAALLAAFENPETMLRGVSDLVRQGFQEAVAAGVRDTSLDELQDYLSDLREISEIRWSDGARQLSESVRHFDELWHSLEQLTGQSAAATTAAQDLAAAEIDTWNARYRALTGQEESKEEQLERMRRDADLFDKQRAMRIAELKLKEAEMRIDLERLRGQREFVGGHAQLQQAELNASKAYLEAKGGLVLAEATLQEQQIAAMQATIDAIVGLIESLEAIPDIAGNVKLPSTGRGGGGGGGGTGALRDLIAASNSEAALAGMSAYARGVAEINRKWDEGIRGAGDMEAAERRAAKERADAIKAAHGNADAIKRANEAYQRAIQHIERTRDAIDDANAARQRELDVLRDQNQAAVRASYDAATSRTGDIDSVRQEFAALRDAVNEAGFSADETTEKLTGLAAAEARRLAEIEGGIGRELFDQVKDMPEFAARALEFAQLELEAKYEGLRLQLVALGVWEKWADVWKAAHDKALEALVKPPGQLDDHMQAANDNARGIRNELADALSRLKQFTDDLLLDERLTTLSPEAQVAEARRQLVAAEAAARTGNPAAIADLQRVERDVLDVFRRAFASGSDYQSMFDYIIRLNRMLEGAPQYADGGYIARRQLAWLHPREVVIPLDRAPGLGRNDNGAIVKAIRDTHGANMRQRSAENAELWKALDAQRRETSELRRQLERRDKLTPTERRAPAAERKKAG